MSTPAGKSNIKHTLALRTTKARDALFKMRGLRLVDTMRLVNHTLYQVTTPFGRGMVIVAEEKNKDSVFGRKEPPPKLKNEPKVEPGYIYVHPTFILFPGPNLEVYQWNGSIAHPILFPTVALSDLQDSCLCLIDAANRDADMVNPSYNQLKLSAGHVESGLAQVSDCVEQLSKILRSVAEASAADHAIRVEVASIIRDNPDSFVEQLGDRPTLLESNQTLVEDTLIKLHQLTGSIKDIITNLHASMPHTD